MGVVNERGRRQTIEQVPVTTLTSPPCVAVGDGGTTLRCPAPSVVFNASTPIQLVGFGLLMDGVVSIQNLNGTLVVYPNPTFQNLVGETSFELGVPVSITIEVYTHTHTLNTYTTLIHTVNIAIM